MPIKSADEFESETSEIFVVPADKAQKVQDLLNKNNISFAMAESREEANIIAGIAYDRRYEFEDSWESSSC